jgi:hypothetical protein
MIPNLLPNFWTVQIWKSILGTPDKVNIDFDKRHF